MVKTQSCKDCLCQFDSGSLLLLCYYMIDTLFSNIIDIPKFKNLYLERFWKKNESFESCVNRKLLTGFSYWNEAILEQFELFNILNSCIDYENIEVQNIEISNPEFLVHRIFKNLRDSIWPKCQWVEVPFNYITFKWN